MERGVFPSRAKQMEGGGDRCCGVSTDKETLKDDLKSEHE